MEIKLKEGLLAATVTLAATMTASAEIQGYPPDLVPIKWTLLVSMGATSTLYKNSSTSTTILHGFENSDDCMEAGSKITYALMTAVETIGEEKLQGQKMPYVQCIQSHEKKL